MAIQFARIEIINRARGGKACLKSAYNAREKIHDKQSNVTYNFKDRGDNIYHTVMLPEGVDKGFSNLETLMNSVEVSEKRKNSQLLKDVVIALPADKDLSLEDRINITHRIIDRLGWVQGGVAVQVDIHEPHGNCAEINGLDCDEQGVFSDGANDNVKNSDVGLEQEVVDEKRNWHAHLLVTTRRFTECGRVLGAKARDLNPEFKSGVNGNFIVPEEEIIHRISRDVINEYFKELGLENRVDEISTVPQEHIGPVRMRNILNQAEGRNEDRKIVHIDNMRSGEDLLERVTKTKSIFTIKDLEKGVVDIPDMEKGVQLIKEALASSGLLALSAYTESGETGFVETDCFTTTEVRNEELRILRFAERISLNRSYTSTISMVDAVSVASDVSKAQKEALKYLLLDKSGIKVLRGRAGTGKSYLLGVFNRLSIEKGHRVLGIAPTHKAKLELIDKGFSQADTVKGFLFALKNGRAHLSKNSTIVIDEAGMIANRDLQELLKRAHSHACNVILVGDERQLTSVERGGMFELIAEKFGSHELSEIRRQKHNWSVQMAGAFAAGRTREGVDILQQNNGIKVAVDELHSSLELVNDWKESKFDIKNRLIVTVRNRDANLLNFAIREELKKEGVLKGKEYKIKTREIVGDKTKIIERGYMVGDRILFASSDKKAGISNGEFATLVSVDKGKFVAKLDGSKRGKKEAKAEISFKPNDVSIKHGYAVTIFKSQGASIFEVYVFHNGAGNSRSTYVGLTRHIEKVNLYCNKTITQSLEKLKIQLGRIDHKSISLRLFTREDIEQKQKQNYKFQQTRLSKIGNWLQRAKIGISDRLHVDFDYYNFEKWENKVLKIEKTSKQDELEIAAEDIVKNIDIANDEVKRQEQDLYAQLCSSELKVASGGDRGSVINSFDVVGAIKSASSNLNNNAVLGSSLLNQTAGRRIHNSNKENNKINSKNADVQKRFEHKVNEYKAKRQVRYYNREFEELRSELRFRAESVAESVLGKSNKALSNASTLRYGNKGSLAVCIKGAKAGIWTDYEAGKSGDLIALVQEYKGQDFKEAVEYLKSTVGVNSYTKLVENNNVGKKYLASIENREKERKKEAREAKKVKNLYDRSKSVLNKSVAHKYLQHRGISVGLTEDIKTTGVWDRSTAKSYPAIVAFARNSAGAVTGGQIISLDSKTAKKADIDIVKKSFGKIGGSFVRVQNAEMGTESVANKNANNKDRSITFIAEGLETALSIRESGVKGKILCSLGIGNIKNYMPRDGEMIIIASDNDGIDSNTSKTILAAESDLKSKGAIVQVVSPEKEGDFNDVLKAEGKESVHDRLVPAIMAIKIENDKSANLRTECEQFNKVAKIKFTEIDAEKLQATNLVELMPVLYKEQKMASELVKEYPNASEYSERQLNYDKTIVDSIARDSRFLVNHNFLPEMQLLKYLQQEKDIQVVADKEFNAAQNCVENKIKQDLDKIQGGEQVRGFDGESYMDKSSYLLLIASDKEINLYIKPESKLDLELKHQQEAQKQDLGKQIEKEKGGDFEL